MSEDIDKRFYKTMYFRVTGRNRGMSDLELRVYFQREIIKMEWTSFLQRGGRPDPNRSIPQLEQFRESWMEENIGPYFESYKEAVERHEGGYLDKAHVENVFRQVLSTPQPGALFHCFHCESNIVRRHDSEYCQNCGSWCLIEMDPDTQLIPKAPLEEQELIDRLDTLQVPQHMAEEAQRQMTIEEQHANGINKCGICYDVYNLGDPATMLICNHYFHTDCISPWVATRKTCPECRCLMPSTDPLFNIVIKAQAIKKLRS